MNDVKFLEQRNNTSVHLGTMVRLEEDVSQTAKVYMLIEHDFGEAALVNLTDGRLWSHSNLAFTRGTDFVSYTAFKNYCYVPFTFINSVGIVTKETK